ncbi:MAG: hypothetical protein M1491_09605 [Deltaproteobacteria bacterium]|nr:hypothetical protein [Deltaproteobacteria bacterium]MCL5276815.1 hypothetical protein [Deltaproteobacteria bacterium]
MEDSGSVPMDELQGEIFKMVQEDMGKKQLKAKDITNAMIQKYGEARCSKESCKEAIRGLIDSGKLVYGYFGGSSSIQVPHKEGAEPDK